jgi:hypothetical protein
MKFAEGGFNRVFLLRMDDGFEVIAKIPYRITVPARYLTASEVATMEFLRQKVNIPVPRVYTWSSDKSNPVGVEYIIMEKVSGVVLGDIWWSLSGKERLRVITQLVQCETKMFQSPLPSYGSLYFNGSLPQDMTHPLKGRGYDDAASSSWCIGPVANMAFWHDGRENLKVDRGPCKRPLRLGLTHILGLSPSEYMLSISARERTWDSECAKPRRREFLFSRSEHAIHPNDHIRLLDDFDKVVAYICPPRDDCVSIFRHPDLRLENIFVDPTDFTITGIIDWQGTCALPFFKQAGYPRFLSNNGEGVSRLMELDKLPDHFDSLEPDEKEELQYEHIRRLSCQLYLRSTAKHNLAHFKALAQKLNAVRAELLKRAGWPWDGDLVMFRSALLDVVEHWGEFSGDIPCPLKYRTTQVEHWKEEEKEWSDANDSLEAFRQGLGINEEGWIPSEFYEDSFQRNQELRWKITETADAELQKEMWKAWPFKDDDDLSEWKGQGLGG